MNNNIILGDNRPYELVVNNEIEPRFIHVTENDNIFYLKVVGFEMKSIYLNAEEYKIIKDNVEIVLPRKEFELLYLLASKPGKVFKREEILDTIWGNDVIVGGRTIDVHIRKLREKIGDDFFRTIKGVGYKFEV